MNPDVHRDWVAALRSGRYAQASGKLTQLDPDGEATYCCLGVLCDLAVRANVITARDGDFCRVYGDDEQVNYLPVAVRRWAGLDVTTAGDPTVRWSSNVRGVPWTSTRLSTLNDANVPFRTIAHLIEEQL